MILRTTTLTIAAAFLFAARAAAAQVEGEGKPAEPDKVEAKGEKPVAPVPAVEPPTNGKAKRAADDSPEGVSTKLGNWSLTLYGYAALNVMHDSTQSFSSSIGNGILQPVGTFRGNNNQLIFTVRDSRIGLRIGAPPVGSIKTSANIETDFGATQPSEVTEATTYTTSALRMRQFYLKVETPIIDVYAGQLQDLFGWGGKGFYPNTLAFLGITGEVYHRQPQIRLSKVMGGEAVEVEVAAAATRPVQRASGTPEAQGGLRIAFNRWTGARTQGYGQPTIGPLGLGVSGLWRRFEVAEFIEFPGSSKTATGWGVVANGFIPVIPATDAKDRGNALSLIGEYSRGTGISDMYTDLTGGALFPTLPNPQDRQEAIKPPPVYIQNIDSGIVTYDGDGRLRTINWQGFVVGIQYYLPVLNGRIWVSGNFAQAKSDNIVQLTPIPGRSFIYSQSQYYDGNIFFAITDNLQTAYSFQSVQQTFGDGVKARNYRQEFAMHLFF
jgi:hypothetical protein